MSLVKLVNIKLIKLLSASIDQLLMCILGSVAWGGCALGQVDFNCLDGDCV